MQTRKAIDQGLNLLSSLNLVNEGYRRVLVQSLCGRPSPGMECIPTKFIKEHVDTICDPLLHVLNITLIRL